MNKKKCYKKSYPEDTLEDYSKVYYHNKPYHFFYLYIGVLEYKITDVAAKTIST